jgi:hypothetical protein
MKDYKKSVSIYNSFLAGKGDLPRQDLYDYAELQTAVGNIPVALEFYSRYLKIDPDDDLVARKIWRLNNIQYLYEDSTHFSIRPVNVNSSYGEMCAVPFQNGIVFTSNRERTKMVEDINGKLNLPFYQLYKAELKQDTLEGADLEVEQLTDFGKSIKSRYNTGPVAFYLKGQRMVFASTSENKSDRGHRTLGLYFATLERNKWRIVSAFAYNGNDYSISDVTINEEGTKMYFSSDMKGGLGGKDIYTSTLVNGKWTKPKNIGEPVNTSRNEVFPFLHNDATLFFSSNGHAGIGELDIFKAQVKDDVFGEPENVGYPINSSSDDFGLVLDSLGFHGYLSSNRVNGGFDDDIFEFDMDIQSYPFTITGVIKYKEHTWSDESAILPWPNIQVLLIDSRLGLGVAESITDDDGNFSITIPYFSKYYIQVIDNGRELKASLEIPKQAAETYEHEIVLVKDVFDKKVIQK